jgi:5'-methylthioadenosine phosphorylase
MHRQIGADIIGMTNGPEARLCREAEIAAATMALVTDYDCWKGDEAAVEVDTVIENLHANSAMAKQIIQAVISHIPEKPSSVCHRALDTAIFTSQELWPEKTAADLAPILGRFNGE